MPGTLVTMISVLLGLVIVVVALWLFLRFIRRSADLNCPTCGEALTTTVWKRPGAVCPNCGSPLRPDDRP